MQVQYYEEEPKEPETFVVLSMTLDERTLLVHDMERYMTSRGQFTGALYDFYRLLNVGIESKQIKNSLTFGNKC